MDLQQIIDEQNSLYQPIELPYIVLSNFFTAESVFTKHEKHHSVKEMSAVLALLSLADYEDGMVQDQYQAWFSVGCFQTLSPTFIEDIDDLDKIEQAKLMQMICGYILEQVGEQVGNEQQTTA